MQQLLVQRKSQGRPGRCARQLRCCGSAAAAAKCCQDCQQASADCRLATLLTGCAAGGKVVGDVTVGGFPKNQETFARVSGYVEQTDVHSPLVSSEFKHLPLQLSCFTAVLRDSWVHQLLQSGAQSSTLAADPWAACGDVMQMGYGRTSED